METGLTVKNLQHHSWALLKAARGFPLLIQSPECHTDIYKAVQPALTEQLQMEGLAEMLFSGHQMVQVTLRRTNTRPLYNLGNGTLSPVQ